MEVRLATEGETAPARDPTKIGGSKSGHCRMEIWLDSHGYEPLPFPEKARRTVEIGHAVELLMFNGLAMEDANGDKRVIGNWFKDLGVIKDSESGMKIDTSKVKISESQLMVEVQGFLGHIDAVAEIDGKEYLLDCKTTAGFGYDRAKDGDLLKDVFAREYVFQMQFYMHGLRLQGRNIENAILLYFNKEQSSCMFRLIPFDPALVEECIERLSWANVDSEPTPDFAWELNKVIPLRCRYCSQRDNCASMRGLALEEFHNKQGTLLTKCVLKEAE